MFLIRCHSVISESAAHEVVSDSVGPVWSAGLSAAAKTQNRVLQRMVLKIPPGTQVLAEEPECAVMITVVAYE